MAEHIRKDHAINLARASDGEHRGKEWLVKQLEMIHPADVRPVVRGRWIKLDMHKGMENYKCSICRSECYVPECMGDPMYAYCPMCGAYMSDNDA